MEYANAQLTKSQQSKEKTNLIETGFDFFFKTKRNEPKIRYENKSEIFFLYISSRMPILGTIR